MAMLKKHQTCEENVAVYAATVGCLLGNKNVGIDKMLATKPNAEHVNVTVFGDVLEAWIMQRVPFKVAPRPIQTNMCLDRQQNAPPQW
jgi:hypothetical protein